MKVSSSGNIKYYFIKTLKLTVHWVEIFHSRFWKQIGNSQLNSLWINKRYIVSPKVLSFFLLLFYFPYIKVNVLQSTGKLSPLYLTVWSFKTWVHFPASFKKTSGLDQAPTMLLTFRAKIKSLPFLLRLFTQIYLFPYQRLVIVKYWRFSLLVAC